MNNPDHNEILNSLKGMERAKCPAGMAERLFEAYQVKPVNMWDRAVLLFSNPMFAAACIIGIILINLILVITGIESNSGQIANSDLISTNATLFEHNDSYTKP